MVDLGTECISSDLVQDLLSQAHFSRRRGKKIALNLYSKYFTELLGTSLDFKQLR